MSGGVRGSEMDWWGVQSPGQMSEAVASFRGPLCTRRTLLHSVESSGIQILWVPDNTAHPLGAHLCTALYLDR